MEIEFMIQKRIEEIDNILNDAELCQAFSINELNKLEWEKEIISRYV